MKKFLIKVGDTELSILRSFPLIHLIINEFKDAHIDILGPKEYEQLFLVLPFQINFHICGPEHYDGILSCHKYAYNLHSVFNIDYFFNLDSSQNANLLGKCFKAKHLVGHAEGISKFLVNTKMEREGHQDLSLDWIDAFKKVFKKEETNLQIQSRKLTKHYRQFVDKDYLVINFYYEKNYPEFSFEHWLSLLNLFEDQLLVLVGPKEAKEMYDDMHFKLEKIKSSNRIINMTGLSFLEKSSLIHFSKGVLTKDQGTSFLSNYLGVKNMLIPDNEATLIPRFNQSERLLALKHPSSDELAHGQLVDSFKIEQHIEQIENFFGIARNIRKISA